MVSLYKIQNVLNGLYASAVHRPWNYEGKSFTSYRAAMMYIKAYLTKCNNEKAKYTGVASQIVISDTFNNVKLENIIITECIVKSVTSLSFWSVYSVEAKKIALKKQKQNEAKHRRLIKKGLVSVSKDKIEIQL